MVDPNSSPKAVPPPRFRAPALEGVTVPIDGARHEVILRSVQRQLEQLLDESAGRIGHEVTAYRSLIWQAKATVKAAGEALRRLAG